MANNIKSDAVSPCSYIPVKLFLNLGPRWWVSGQRHAPSRFTPGKTRYPLYRRLGGTQGRFLRVGKISRSDRPASSESLCRLNYSGPNARCQLPEILKTKIDKGKIFFRNDDNRKFLPSNSGVGESNCMNYHGRPQWPRCGSLHGSTNFKIFAFLGCYKV